MHARRRAATAVAAVLLVLTGCSVPGPSEWTYHHSALLRPADDLRAVGDAWRASLTEGMVRANVPADAACYFHLEGGAIQDDVVCGPARRAGHSATIWQQAPITSFYQRSGEVALTLGGDGSFRDVDPRSVGELRAADGSEPDLTVSIGPPRGTELAAGESVEVSARPQTADDRSTYGGCMLTDSALCTVDTAGDSGRRVLGLAGREVLVVFQEVRDAGYAAEPYDAAPGTHLMAVTIVNTRSTGVSGGGGSGEGESDGAELATLMPVGTEGALGGAEDGSLTASLAVGDEKPQHLGELPETTVTADEVFDRLSSDAPPSADPDGPAGTTVRLVAVPDDDPVVVVVSDRAHEAAFRSDEAPTSTTVPADQQDFFPIIDPYGDALPAGMPLGVDGTLDLGGRTDHDTMPVELRAEVSALSNDDEHVLGTDDDGRPRAIAFRPEGAHRATYVPRVEIRDAELTTGDRTIRLTGAADDQATEARATATADLSGIDAPDPAAPVGADDEGTALWEVRLQAHVVLHLDLADDQEGALPSDQPKHLEWAQDVDESPGIFGAPGFATVDGW